MARTQFPLMRSLRLTAITRRLLLAMGAASLAFLLLLIHVFAPRLSLQVVALTVTGVALIAAWTAVLCWRMPVFSNYTLWLFTLLWCTGLCTAVLLVLIAARSPLPWIWRAAVQWVAFSLSLAVGSLQFRALFSRRATPVVGRFVSLLSPLAIVTLIAILAFRSS